MTTHYLVTEDVRVSYAFRTPREQRRHTVKIWAARIGLIVGTATASSAVTLLLTR
jgi:hypothetical protein